MRKILPGEVYRLSLAPSADESAATITVVVISGEAFNRKGSTVWAAPLVPEEESLGSRARVRLTSAAADGWVLLDALRSVDLAARGAVLLDQVPEPWALEARLKLIHWLSGG